MGDLIHLEFDGNEAFQRDVEVIVENLVDCFYDHFGEESGRLLATALSAALDDISTQIIKRLEVKKEDEDFEVEFVPDFPLD